MIRLMEAVWKAPAVMFLYVDALLLFWQVVMVTSGAPWWIPIVVHICMCDPCLTPSLSEVDVYICWWRFVKKKKKTRNIPVEVLKRTCCYFTLTSILFTQSREIFDRYCAAAAVSYSLADELLHPLHRGEECLLWEELETRRRAKVYEITLKKTGQKVLLLTYKQF